VPGQRRRSFRAAVVPGFGLPLVIEDRPVPEPGPGQVVVRMEASGLCHTDIHAANGDWPVTPTVPFIPGHEGVGIVTALGDGVTSPQMGTSVIGSIVGTRADLNEVFALHAAGRTRVSYETRPLAEVNEAIAEVLHGKARARLVLVP
jgi:D-arabinose 1-dehydrogenase-like Zn-dependent alcohol dehydrogenase